MLHVWPQLILPKVQGHRLPHYMLEIHELKLVVDPTWTHTRASLCHSLRNKPFLPKQRPGRWHHHHPVPGCSAGKAKCTWAKSPDAGYIFSRLTANTCDPAGLPSCWSRSAWTCTRLPQGARDSRHEWQASLVNTHPGEAVSILGIRLCKNQTHPLDPAERDGQISSHLLRLSWKTQQNIKTINWQI